MSSDYPYLPHDLIYIVIKMTDDVQTLQNWCLATRFNKLLHPMALKKRWTITELTWPDVVGWAIDEPALWLKRATYPTLLNGRPIYPAPASLIHRLVLSFGPDDPRNYGIPFDKIILKKFGQEHILFSLLARCNNLKEISHSGHLLPEILSRVCDLHRDGLLSLHLQMTPPITSRQRRHIVEETGIFRSSFCRYEKSASDGPIYPNWARLMRLKTLKRLEIGHLSPICAYDLAGAINHLPSLEKLLIVMAPNNTQQEESGMKQFLERAFHSGGITRLKSLTLSDPEQGILEPTVTTGGFTRPPKPNICPLLTDLYLDIGDHDISLKIFDLFELPALLRLSLPSGVMYNSRWRSPDPQSTESFFVIHDIIDLHKESLRQITFLNIWRVQEMKSSDFFKGFEPQELVLGVNSRVEKTFFTTLAGSQSSNRLSQDFVVNSSFNSDKLYFNAFYFGKTLRRLRIDQVDFYSGLLSGWFKEPWFLNLKILMLHPRPLSDLSLGCLNCSEKDIRSFREGNLAIDIAEHLPEIRVIVLGLYRFWVEEPESQLPIPKPCERKVWHLELAQKDSVQRHKIADCLVKRDWDFLSRTGYPAEKDRDRYRTKDFPGANLLLATEPAIQMKKHANFIVLLRDDEDSREPMDEDGEEGAQYLAGLKSWNYE